MLILLPMGSAGTFFPEVDGVVIIENSAGLDVGEFARVRITDAGDHDLWAESV